MTLAFCFLVSILFCEQLHNVRSHCIGTCYSGPTSLDSQRVIRGEYLKGYTYKNITIDDHSICYRHCVQDCRCKASQIKGNRCELLDEDKTSKSIDFGADSDYTYMDLKQTIYHGKQSHMVAPGECYNGCCRSKPCLNGGKCVEHCNSPKEKFTCTCDYYRYEGNVCEKRKTYKSCEDVFAHWETRPQTKPKDGPYPVQLSKGKITDVFCSFIIGNKNRTWTLIESFAFKNNNIFKTEPFYVDFKVNQDKPQNWEAYRLGLEDMKVLRLRSVMFRATCDFHDILSTEDRVNGFLDEVDIIKNQQIDGCKRYNFLKLNGKSCSKCEAFTVHGENLHFHLSVTDGVCSFNSKDIQSGANRFGYYDIIDSQSHCTSTNNSTTQWWLGKIIPYISP